jgi:RecG-like helicase
MSSTTRGGLHYPLGSLLVFDPGQTGLASTSKASLDPARLDRPVSTVRGVGKATERKMRNMGIETVRDLLLHLPFRHEPPSRICSISGLRLGEEVTLRVRVLSSAVRETARRRIKVLEALVSDDSGSVLATWYNQAYLEAAFREQPEVLLKGVLIRQRGASTTSWALSPCTRARPI